MKILVSIAKTLATATVATTGGIVGYAAGGAILPAYVSIGTRSLVAYLWGSATTWHARLALTVAAEQAAQASGLVACIYGPPLCATLGVAAGLGALQITYATYNGVVYVIQSIQEARHQEAVNKAIEAEAEAAAEEWETDETDPNGFVIITRRASQIILVLSPATTIQIAQSHADNTIQITTIAPNAGPPTPADRLTERLAEMEDLTADDIDNDFVLVSAPRPPSYAASIAASTTTPLPIPGLDKNPKIKASTC